MTVATALLLAVLHNGIGTAPAPQATSGIILAADIEGRVAVFDADNRLVVDLDKPAGRQLQIALEPGAYDVRLGSHGSTRARIQIGDGQLQLLARANFKDPNEDHATAGDAAVSPHHDHRPLDSRHRIEMRFGGWGDGWYDEHGHASHYGGSARAAFGLEYVNFVRNDLGIGVAITSLASADGGWQEWDGGGAGRAMCSIPVVARWYPVRRLTRTRAVEPYLTAGLGPVFGANSVYASDSPHGWHDDHWVSGHVETAFGGRLGGGVDFRLGHVFTMGVAGAWNWDTGFSNEIWGGAKPGGGEFTVTLGWNFGR